MWSGTSNPWAGGGGQDPGTFASHAPLSSFLPCKGSRVQGWCEGLCDGACAAKGQCCAVINTYVKSPGVCECSGSCGPCDGTPVKRI